VAEAKEEGRRLKVGFHIAGMLTGRALTGDRMAIVLNGARAMPRRLQAAGR